MPTILGQGVGTSIRAVCAGPQTPGEVLGAFVQELSRSLKWRAKRLHGLSTMGEAQTGGVAATERVDSAL